MSDKLPSSGPKLPAGGACQERAGFLFAHECDQPGTAFCVLCRKLICQRHLRAVEQGEACVTCAQAAGARTSDDDPFYYRTRYRDYSYYDAADRRAFSRASGTAAAAAAAGDAAAADSLDAS